jgi:hypothetical protein
MTSQSDTECEKRPIESQWSVPGDLLVCYRCGSIWSIAMMGDWLPLSCVGRKRVPVRSKNEQT